MLSGTGEVSSKRFSGIITLLISLGCIIYLTVNEGGTTVVESLLQTAMIIAASLLGISSVTSIWKDRKNNSDQTKNES